MRTSYPFFRDGDKTAQAVIGEGAAASDLDGVYQKPYAVLTQKRLYCKNEQGNFIVDASALRSTGKASSMKNNWFVWAVAGCLALTLIVLACQQLLSPSRGCHRWRSWQARRVITDYETLEAKIDGYRQTVKTYEDTLAQKEQHEQDLQKLDPARVRQALEAHQEQIASLQGEIRSNEDQINKYEREISLTQDRIDSLPQWLGDAQKQLASYQNTLQTLENLYWQKPSSSLSSRISSFRSSIAKEKERIESFQSQIKDIPNMEAAIRTDQQKTASCHQAIAQARTQLSEHQKALENAGPTLSAIETLEQSIAGCQKVLKGIAYEQILGELERYETGGESYRSAQSALRKNALVWPCLGVLAALLLLFSVLLMRRVKAAMAACAAILAESVYFWLLGLREYRSYAGSPMSRLTLFILALIPATLVLSLLALWWDHRKTVFQVVHATGSFAFSPRAYPAEDLSAFAAQVKHLRSAESRQP